MHPLVFDASMMDIYGAITNGAQLHIISGRDPSGISWDFRVILMRTVLPIPL